MGHTWLKAFYVQYVHETGIQACTEPLLQMLSSNEVPSS
jgi:hypothetical protein